VPTETIANPNFSIVLPGACQARCGFCYWKRSDNELRLKAWASELNRVLGALPPQFKTLSLTGGETVLSPYLKRALSVIELHKERFDRVVLTTNGGSPKNFDKLRDLFDGVVDHINLSRHALNELENRAAFGDCKTINWEETETFCTKMAEVGIDVTISAVLGIWWGEMILGEWVGADKAYTRAFLAKCKSVGAGAVFLRKLHGTLDTHPLQDNFSEEATVEHGCPTCKDFVMTIDGVRVHWKYSTLEPSDDLGLVYEVILQPDGRMTTGWTTDEPYELPVPEPVRASVASSTSGCGGTTRSCGS